MSKPSQAFHASPRTTTVAPSRRGARLALVLLTLPGWAACALPGSSARRAGYLPAGGTYPAAEPASATSHRGSAAARPPRNTSTRVSPAAPTGPRFRGRPSPQRRHAGAYRPAPITPQPAAPPLAHRNQSVTRAPSGAGLAAPPPQERPGLGTRFGERLISRVRFTAFVRSSTRPAGAVAIHYNDRQGLYAMARYLRRSCCTAMPATQVGGGVSVRLVDAAGRALPGLQIGGRTIIMGHSGHRYTIEIQNHTANRYEIVASVDGLDVIDGRPANVGKRGYILSPWGHLHIMGYRTSTWTVAAFRFGSVRGAYATRTTGSSRNVGVVGVAVFTERAPVWSRAEVLRRLRARPFGPSPYAQPPRY